MASDIPRAEAILQLLAAKWADDLPCSVNQTYEGTRYQVNLTDATKEFFWKNGTEYTLAFQEDSNMNKTEQVLRYSKSELLLKTCKEIILYSTTDSQGVIHKATCTSACTQGTRPDYTVWYTLLGVGLLVLLVVGVMVCLKRCK